MLWIIQLEVFDARQERHHEPIDFQTQLAADLPAGKAPELSKRGKGFFLRECVAQPNSVAFCEFPADFPISN